MWVAMPLDIIQRAADHEAGRLRRDEDQRRPSSSRSSRNKHTWSMTALYIVTFGSFIGFSMALPLSITVIFGVSHVPDAAGVMQHVLKNPNAPSALTYAWIGPFVGALCDRWAAGSRTSSAAPSSPSVISAVMVVASVAVGYVMMQAYRLGHAGTVLPACSWACSWCCSSASGIGNGSTFRTIGVIFDRTQAGPVLGWTSAVAAYGAFIAPVVIGEQIKAGTPELAMYGFAVFYAICLVLNWWFYLRKQCLREEPLITETTPAQRPFRTHHGDYT
jgi:NNP family nitrate/nitrite transporter-like MFS transporter